MSFPTLPIEFHHSAEQTSPAEAIVFENVELAFESKVVLDGISFRLAHGETKAIFGVAGSGKSTILKLALGLIRADAGRIVILGNDIAEMTEDQLFELRRRVGIVFQESALFDSLTVRENVAYRLLEEGNVSEEEVENRVREALSFVELQHTVDLYPAELSGGMRRRVAIARTIITHPEVVLYDSPTGGLDPVTSNTIIELVVKQRDVYKTSSLLVTHRLQDAFTLGTHYFDRAENKMKPLPTGSRAEVPMGFLILRDGRIIFDGDIRELRETQDPYIREYLS
ncbi:MAG TPA: ATP-binding cassette domain-containing protein [Terriglobales bacterium]|jgi:phospholipid/cholesterol/gamma-HCH transport system ATP-binding protein